ncbi:2-oxo acid dehydrogenase subunit E2 [Salisediminibacterium halotolerans]|uniref:2-oxo acid dehydrogenase subunit E2 n=1 Tax=Salisediminibacterium halotolerans TaxID=517425 RepID=UPI000EAE726E|nr:2-oxo acid dehydrogenase subunit E2 [Salisediminibacterium halotolerans]RLJ75502.1 2-oxoacid dehydrogenase/acyltransferase catalytic subunit [Actinophytocola xinjiangensis]RPE89355.1 2-oxoacid dehydrogenase/acyltransferase catalytic subunit [Salisediminibacterium halotolerans]TWG36115.1 2-oxoacid dehydrogenase/acyltransferase catalytic subunit [Salisediminibacterium halotolerans]GEL08041.1 hypothetical protein SHA02_14570 [Salisediminibacterium halotolerans]
MKQSGDYRSESFSSSRLATIDIGAASKMKHHVYAFIELDVTDARHILQDKKQQGEIISFNAWFIKCISKTVESCDSLHGIRKGKKNIIVFADIDISIMIERELNGVNVPLPYVLRKTNDKGIAEIQAEIRSGQTAAINDEGDYVLGETKNAFFMKVYYALPGCCRRILWKNIIKRPFLTKKLMGTVMVSSVGMIGKINGWVLPVSVHPLSFTVGSIIQKPGVKDGNIELRDFLFLTVAIDHNVIDGATAVRALTKLVEDGDGL